MCATRAAAIFFSRATVSDNARGIYIAMMDGGATACQLAARMDADLDAGAFKNIAAEHQPNYADVLLAQDEIKKYIQTRGCILYGGIAIDYALRLRGDKIYADDDLPDFDFWSPAHVETAREIVNILSARLPHATVYGTRAQFPRTMRVSVGDNNWVADVTYLPRELYDRIPTLAFDGMRIVHPHFQFSDQHSSLSYPYDGAPREVVFARWKKDIARFNKLFAAYPLERAPASVPKTTQIAVPSAIIAHSLLFGFAAYSLYYNALIRAHPDAARDPDLRRIPTARDIQVAESRSAGDDDGARFILVDVPYELVEIYAHRDTIQTYSAAKNPRKFYPLIDLIDAHMIATVGSPPATLIAFVNRRNYAGYHSFALGAAAVAQKVRAINIQGLLKYFIGCYLRAKYFPHVASGPVIPESVYLSYYEACLVLIAKSRGTSVAHLFEPSLSVFGERGAQQHDLIAMHANVINQLGSGEKLDHDLILPPKNIKALSSTAPPPAPFQYETCAFLKIAGEELLA
jgi:hypothetical protein